MRARGRPSRAPRRQRQNRWVWRPGGGLPRTPKSALRSRGVRRTRVGGGAQCSMAPASPCHYRPCGMTTLREQKPPKVPTRRRNAHEQPRAMARKESRRRPRMPRAIQAPRALLAQVSLQRPSVMLRQRPKAITRLPVLRSEPRRPRLARRRARRSASSGTVCSRQVSHLFLPFVTRHFPH